MKKGIVSVCTRNIHDYIKSEGFTEICNQIRIMDQPEITFLLINNSGEESTQAGECDLDFIKIIDEHKKGIPHARNAALNYAIEVNAEWLLFTDDDCIPSQEWLREMVNNFLQLNCDVVQGGWRFVYPEEYPNYLPRLEDSRFIKSEILDTASTRNIIFDIKKYDEIKLEFDTSLNLIGGSDTLFFSKLKESGQKICAIDSGIVFEVMGDERSTFKWHFKRRIRTTQSWLIRNSTLKIPVFSNFIQYFFSLIKITSEITKIIFYGFFCLFLKNIKKIYMSQ